MNDSDKLKKIEAVLFLKDSEAAEQLTPFENERRKRWLFCISARMEDPLLPDKVLVERLENGMSGVFSPVQKSTAYRDLGAVSIIIGNIQLAGKNWYRYIIIEGAKKAYEIAETKKDAKGMAAALNLIGKYTMADRPDNDIDWSQLVPPSFEPSADPDLLENVEVVENVEERRKELRALFKIDMKNSAEDATISE